MIKNIVMITTAAAFLAGCASKSADISAAYVSPMQFQNYSCAQLSTEAQRIASRAGQVMGAQDKKASNDSAMMGVGMILFWPALFALKGDSETASEVARLKGEMEAIESASIQKKCDIQFKRP